MRGNLSGSIWDAERRGCGAMGWRQWRFLYVGVEVCGIYMEELWCVGVAGCGSYCVWESQSVGVTVCGD